MKDEGITGRIVAKHNPVISVETRRSRNGNYLLTFLASSISSPFKEHWSCCSFVLRSNIQPPRCANNIPTRNGGIYNENLMSEGEKEGNET